MAKKKKITLGDALLDRIVDIGNNVDDVGMQIVVLQEQNEEWLKIASVYTEKFNAVTDAQDELNKFKSELLLEPNIKDIMSRLAELKAVAKDVVLNDPLWSAIKSFDSRVQDIVTDSCAPYVQAINEAQKEKEEYVRYMQSPEVRKLKECAERIK